MGTRLSVEGGTAVCTSRSSGVALGQLADAQQRAAPPPWSRGLGGARGDADGQQTAELRPGGEEGDSSGRGDLEVGVADGVEHRRAGDPFGPAEQRDEVYQQVGGRREDSQPGAPCCAAQPGDDQGGDRAEDSGEEQDVGEHPDQTERVKVRADGQHHRPIAGDSELAEAVKALARTHQNLIWTRQRQTNALRSTLREFYPAALVAFDDLASRDARSSNCLLYTSPSPR